MSTTPHILANGDYSQNWSGTSAVLTNNNWDGLASVVGYLGDLYTQPVNTDPQTVLGPQTSNTQSLINASTPANTGGGVHEINDDVVALQGSGTADAPQLVFFLNSTGRANVRFQATARELDATTVDQKIAVQYRIGNTGDFINLPGGAVNGVFGAAGNQSAFIDVTLPPAANNQPLVQIRVLTNDATGSDAMIGIDDIVISSVAPTGPGSLAINDQLNVAEGAAGATTPVTFTVTRSDGTTGAVNVNWALDFTGVTDPANAADFSGATSGTVSFADGVASQTITVNIAGDATPELLENYRVLLSGATGGATIADGVGLGSIANDDGAPIAFAIADLSQAEGTGGTTTFNFTVTRTGPTDAASVNYTTVAGTATAGSDFTATSGTLNFAAGQTTATVAVNVNADAVGEFAETFSVVLSGATGGALISRATATGTIVNDDALLISQIQGPAYYSPVLKADGISAFNQASTTTVTVRAVVTAVDAVGARQGFYLTEEVAEWDASNLTSEGIFVMAHNDTNDTANPNPAANGVSLAALLSSLGAPADLKAGDLVTVTAKVMEYQSFNSMPRTVLWQVSGITRGGENQALPTLVLDSSRPIPNAILTEVTPNYTDSDGSSGTFNAATRALSYFETIEGMRVSVPGMVVADGVVSLSGGKPYLQAYSTVHANPEQINSRGGYTVAGDPPLGPPDTASTLDNTLRDGRVLHDGDINPDVIELDFTDFAVAAPAGLQTGASMGDPLGTVTGIIDFDFTDRKLFVTDAVTGFVDRQPIRETTTLAGTGSTLTFATFNVENLDPTDVTAAQTAAQQGKFFDLARAIVNNLNMPDILSIEEIQDNNGAAAGDGISPTGSDASATWQMLIDAVNAVARAAGRTAAYQWVDQAPIYNAEGGEQSGNIRVGFLYNTNRVQLGDLAADATIEARRAFTDRIGDGVRDAGDRIAFDDSQLGAEIVVSDYTSVRRSLLGEFTFLGEKVYALANHFQAKSGSGEFYQFNQNLDAGAPANAAWAARNNIAQDIYAMMNLIQGGSSTANIISGGDFNDFYFYRPLTTLTGYTLADGSARVGGARFDNLALKLPEAERFTYNFDGRSQAIDHILVNNRLNAVGQVDVVHLNTGYNSQNAANNPALSDHDPVVSSFNFGTLLAQTRTGGVGDDSFTTGEGSDTFTLTQGGNDTANGGGGDDGFYFGTSLNGDDRVNGGTGRNDTIVLAGSQTTTITPTAVTAVEVIVAQPGGAYNLTLGGNIAGVDPTTTFTVYGSQLGAGDSLTFNGAAASQLLRVFGGAGADSITTGSGADFIYFGPGKYDPARDFVDGGAGNDTLGLDGTYTTLTLDGTRLVSIEAVQLVPGPVGAFSIFNLTIADSFVGAGETKVIVGSGVQTSISINASAETTANGALLMMGGAAADTLIGGAGADTIMGDAGNDTLIGGLGGDALTGGAGADRFQYAGVADSRATAFDRITGLEAGDVIVLPQAVTSVAGPVSGSASLATLDANLTAAIGAGQLGTGQALVFTASGGDLNGRAFLVIDANGTAGYQAGADYVIELVAPQTPVTTGLFVDSNIIL